MAVEVTAAGEKENMAADLSLTVNEEENLFSTPLTVKDRVKEYDCMASRESLADRSLSSSQSSLRDFDSTDKAWMLAASCRDQAAMQKMLIGSRRLVNYRFPFNGFTALHFAAKANDCHCCRFLLDRGADPNVKTYSGQTALHLACMHECREAIVLLHTASVSLAQVRDYAGKLAHELIRNQESMRDLLMKLSGTGSAKRGSFLGEYPKAVAPRSESWLSGVRASFRGKSGSGQPKVKAGNSLQLPGNKTPLIPENPKAKRSHSNAQPLPPPPPSPPPPPEQQLQLQQPVSILDNVTNQGVDKKKRSTKKTL